MSRNSKAKKLVLVSTTFMLVIGANKKAPKVVLSRVLCIYYLVQFWKDEERATIQALIDSGSEINTITLAYAKPLGFWTWKTDVGAQKINNSLLATYEIVIAAFLIKDKLGRAQFFQETFLLANISMEVVLGMLFFTFSNADIQFAKKELMWKFYTAKKAPPITYRVELIDKKEFVKVALDEHIEAFVVHVSSLSLGSKMTIHPAWKAQIALLLAKKVTIPAKYLEFADAFSK